MRTYILASEDASIYERYPSFNTGLDEILTIGTEKDPLDEVYMYASSSVRSLLTFDLTEAQADHPAGAKYYLNLYIANAVDIHRYQTLEVYPISRSWVEGSGYRYQDVKNVEDGVTWQSASVDVQWLNSGSDYITSPSASYTLSKYPIEDIRIDVSDIIEPVVQGTAGFTWNGLLLKFPNASETSSANRGNLKVFSSDTHTVFAPRLEALWSDQTFNTGSLDPIPNSSVSIIPKNLKGAYTVGEVDKVYLIVRDPYPDKRFDAKKRYEAKYYLPSESYYRIRDELSDIKIHDFDEYSAISCDASGSYILLDTSGLEVDRYYTIDLKVDDDPLVYYPEFLYSFKVDSDG